MIKTDMLISNNKSLKLRFMCKKDKCGGVIEGTPQEILANKEHKFVVKCPKCACELSGGRRFHITEDQVKGLCTLFNTMINGNNSFDFAITYELEIPKPIETAEPHKTNVLGSNVHMPLGSAETAQDASKDVTIVHGLMG